LSGDHDEAARRYRRLAAIDVAIRAAAFDLLTGTPSAPPALEDHAEVPVWANRGMHELIRKLPRSLGATRAELTKRKALDDLFSGRHRPSPHTINSLAKVLATKDSAKTPVAAWHVHLLWLFALDDLTKELTKVVGAAEVEEVARAFRRIRRHARRRLESASVDRDALRMLVVHGAIAARAVRCSVELSLIDALTRDEHASLMGKIDRNQAESEWRPHVQWAMELRSASADWVVSELSKFISFEPIPPEGMSEEVLAPLLTAMATSDVHVLMRLIDDHPAAGLWLARSLVQQAFIRGNVRPIVAMVARFADAAPSPGMHFEAGLVHAAAGLHDAALRHFDAIGDTEPFASWATSVRVVSLVMSGRHADGLQTIDAINSGDSTDGFLQGLALYGLGQVEDALAAFEDVLDKVPDHADSLVAASMCCDELSKSARGEQRRQRSIARNRYRRRAMQLGVVRIRS
jgi:hypothetical protein